MAIVKSKTETIENKLPDRLKIVQGDQRLKDFASEFGETPSNMSKYLTGYTSPSIELLEKLSRAGVNLNWLVAGEGEIYSTLKESAKTPTEIQRLMFEVDSDTKLAKYLLGIIEAHRKYDETIRKFETRKDSDKTKE